VLSTGREMALRVPEVREGLQFFMVLTFEAAPSRALAMQIFDSIRFPEAP